MASTTINVVGGIRQTATFTVNEYVSAGEFVFVQIGKVVVFRADYTMAQNITSSAPVGFSGMPPVSDNKNVRYPDWDIEDTSDFSDNGRNFQITGNNIIRIKGEHTSGKTYRSCGVYFTT